MWAFTWKAVPPAKTGAPYERRWTFGRWQFNFKKQNLFDLSLVSLHGSRLMFSVTGYTGVRGESKTRSFSPAVPGQHR